MSSSVLTPSIVRSQEYIACGQAERIINNPSEVVKYCINSTVGTKTVDQLISQESFYARKRNGQMISIWTDGEIDEINASCLRIDHSNNPRAVVEYCNRIEMLWESETRGVSTVDSVCGNNVKCRETY